MVVDLFRSVVVFENLFIYLFISECLFYVGIWVFIVMLFVDDVVWLVDYGVLYILVVWYCVLGVVGFVVCGSIGEVVVLID